MIKPVVLAILDGWGISPSWGGNAIEMYNPRFFNTLWRSFPHLVLKSVFSSSYGSGILANSEIGHMMIGSGRQILSDCEVIDSLISTPEFYQNQNFRTALDEAIRYNSDFHLIGMISNGSVHSSIEHILRVIDFCKSHNFSRLYLHLITDGRDCDKNSAPVFIKMINDKIKQTGVGHIATISGRHYAMDRDNHWDLSLKYYQTLIGQKVIKKSLDAMQSLKEGYTNGLNDETLIPTQIVENGFPVGIIKNNDVVFLANFRSDRMRQLYMLLTGLKKHGLFDKRPRNIRILTFLAYHFSEYSDSYSVSIFPESPIKNTITEILSQNLLSTLKIAESEKRAHVTYFFNGGVDAPFPHEERQILKSIETETFSKTPQMRAVEITNKISEAVDSKKYSLIAVNYANVDEVAHTGDIIATSKAVEITDNCLAELLELVKSDKITLIVTADHGNGEQMVNSLGRLNPETFHTINPVPFILADSSTMQSTPLPATENDWLSSIAKTKFSLSDVAPTILDWLNIPVPGEMTGKSLLIPLQINRRTNESSN